MPTLEERDATNDPKSPKVTVAYLIGSLRGMHFGTRKVDTDLLYYAADDLESMNKEIAHQKVTEAKLESSIEAFSELVEIYKETEAELEKVIMMIYGRGHLDFDDEGWDLYEKVTEQILSKQRNKNDG